MNTPPPEICDHPLIQADDLSFYIADRFRDGTLDLYSAFLLNHEALRIRRTGYLQPAWNYKLSISGLFEMFMHCVTARALRVETMGRIAEKWFAHDIPLLAERRPHFLVDRLSEGSDLITNCDFLRELSDMRAQYDSLPDDEGPYHVEVLPGDVAAPERELLVPGSQSEFHCDRVVDPAVEKLILELCAGQWA